MAHQSLHDVVNKDMSVGEPSPVDAHASHDHLQSHAAPGTTTELPELHHNTSPDQLHVHVPNGTVHDHAHAPADDQHGSDTDTSRAEESTTSKDGKSSRLGSVKKPTSFKAVSITKSFLAKTATAQTPPPPKVGEKEVAPPTSTLQPLAKPRLVVKSGSSGLRDVPRARPGDGTSTPDGRTVWNRNQPVPPPPPKQFTDEELKQRYGIHLATRLQSDEATEQKAKWADIDEDDDEWTPEAVEWMDGTRTTISAADNTAAQPEPKPAEVEEAEDKKEEEEQPPVAKPTLTALKRPTSTAPPSATRTILRPGQAQQARQGGADGKATSDKPTLVAKGPAPAPSKSPWASLPPVEKVSPVAINPPAIAPPPPRFSQRDAHGFDAISQHMPTREIATDTFDRSWRESDRANQQLFNSHSGRYEPAPELRRGSRQAENAHGKQPAVLLRPSPQSGPAEPSAAFQSRSSAQVDSGSWIHRRGSSVSGSLPNDRRMSVSSKVFDSSEAPAEASMEQDAVTSPAQPSDTASQIDQSQQHMVQTDGASPALSVADERERQKKLMQEKREAAIRRKQEEEAREEAERRERIRKKMEALGMPTEKSPASPSQQKSQPADTHATQKSTPDKAPAVQPAEASVAEAPRQEEQPRLDAQKPPSKQSSPTKERAADPSMQFPQNQPSVTRPQPKSLPSQQLPGLQQHSPNGPSRSPYRQSSLQGVASSAFSSPGDQPRAQPARLPSISGTGTDAFATTPWGSTSMATHTTPGSNVWGPPTNNRHIGNGTFDAGYSSISPGSRPQHQSAPFSTPFGRQYPSRISPKTFGQSGPSPPAAMDQPFVSLSNLDSRMSEPAGASAIVGTSPLPEPARLSYPTPIAPPQKATSRAQQAPQRDTSAWTTFAMNAQVKEEAEAARLAAERTQQPSPTPRWTETFKQTRGGDNWLNGSRQTLAKEQIIRGGGVPPHKVGAIGQSVPAPQSPVAHQHLSPQALTGEQIHIGGEGVVRLPTGPSSYNKSLTSHGDVATSNVRLPPLAAYAGNVQTVPAPPVTPGSAPQQSRFFPSALYGGSPPPEESDHPVCGGDAKHPHVNLPMPKPKVKLPPAPTSDAAPQPSPVTMPRSVHSFRVGAQPLVQTQDWQARFNGLFGKAQITTTTPPSPPKTPPKMHTPAPAVATISKASIDFVATPSATTVSLPRSVSPPILATNVLSKPGVDDIFNGELSFGSTPRIFLPRGVRYPEVFGRDGSPAPSRLNSRLQKRVEAQSKNVFYIADNTTHDVSIRISFCFSDAAAKHLTLPRKNKTRSDSRGRKNPSRPNKAKRSGPNAITSRSPTSASPALGNGNRKTSHQKGQISPAVESAARSSPAEGAKAQIDSEAFKETPWTKVPRGKAYKPKP